MNHYQAEGSGRKITISRIFPQIRGRSFIGSLFYESCAVANSDSQELKINGLPIEIFFVELKNLTQIIGLNLLLRTKLSIHFHLSGI